MRRCTCTVFSRDAALHNPDCARRKAHKQRPTLSERRAGKHDRIKAMVKVLRPDHNAVVDEQLVMLLGVQEERE